MLLACTHGGKINDVSVLPFANSLRQETAAQSQTDGHMTMPSSHAHQAQLPSGVYHGNEKKVTVSTVEGRHRMTDGE